MEKRKYFYAQVSCSKIINSLDASKATDQGDIPTKIMKGDKNTFCYFISANFNNAVNKDVFPEDLKNADFKPIYKRNLEMKKKIIGMYVFYKTYQKYLNVLCMIDLKVTLKRYCQKISAYLERI